VNSADTTIPAEGIRRCNESFDIEKSLGFLSPEKRQKERLRQEKPVLAALWLWLDTISGSIPYNGKLADAVNYAKNHKDGLLTYLEDGNCVISNNLAENSIRPFTVGRKNWLFCGSPKGASASATVYSLIETAKANHLNPYNYLLHLLRDMPGEDFLRHPEFLEDHLPWNPRIQLMCK
jgi:transposase